MFSSVTRFLLILLFVVACSPGCSQSQDNDVATNTDSDSDEESDSRNDSDEPFNPNDTNTSSDDSDPDGPDCVYVPHDFDIHQLPGEAPLVDISISVESMAILDADPFHAEDETGAFKDGAGTDYVGIDVNYRGAYALQSLMNDEDTWNLRNWKLKFNDDQKYRNRREWNYNYEPHLRQKLALDLLAFNGVAVPSARHVILQVNGEYHGMYIEYEDPDNKDWLCDMYGHDNGDLYKAAYDLPDEEQYFATLEILGSEDSDYFLHYNKKTNHKIAPEDYSVLRLFVEELNNTPDDQFEQWLESRFDVGSFIAYLVVSNFISNWDSYPQRPKNFWLYENLRTDEMVFIPWDLDATFQEAWSSWPGTPSLNQMGTDCSIYFNLQNADNEPYHAAEGTARPLVRRMMNRDKYMNMYLTKYQEAVEITLNPTYLNDRIDSLTEIIYDKLSAADREKLDESNGQVKEFIQLKYENVMAELDQL
ncbi:MAG: CotH kinase family protein [Deltaproteobacteria bacterium]|nr:CotH kinase family protein [Deltaproteobacteria bacterium]MBN2670384.1 CotH kinase family protein [Deltaproteobacteria bacterium]